jgi:hypothetical protein
MHVGDVQFRSASFASTFAAENLTIANVNSVTISRTDCTPITSGDLTIQSGPYIDTTFLVVTVELANGNAGVTYCVEFSVLASDGETFIRDAFQLVVSTLT